MDRESVESNVCIVPAQFCAMKYINDASYLPEETTLKIDSVNNSQENVCTFCRAILHHRLKTLAIKEILVLKRFLKLLSKKSFQCVMEISTGFIGREAYSNSWPFSKLSRDLEWLFVV